MSRDKEKKVSIFNNHTMRSPSDNKFVLCEFGEKVLELHKKYPNDKDFGTQIRQIILLWKPNSNKI